MNTLALRLQSSWNRAALEHAFSTRISCAATMQAGRAEQSRHIESMCKLTSCVCKDSEKGAMAGRGGRTWQIK
ncbi:hypothetical protein ANTQUA_LOCUS2820 [Anthophora quadrimaculata]